LKEFHFVQPQFPYFGRQKTEISESAYNNIRKIIADAKNKVLLNNEIVNYSDKRFEFVIVPDANGEELKEACSQLHLHDIDGLPIQFNDTDRIIRDKIRDKKTQIPERTNGILYIKVNPVFFMIEDLETSISKIETSMIESKNLLGVVIHARVVDSREN
jgi:hypothetical protein